MKQISMACAIGAVLCISSAAFAQTNPPSSATGLQAGDNTDNVPTHTTTHHKKKKTKKMGASATSAETPGTSGTATPGGPGAPVSASGSGQ
jgi:hypothetical protein